MSDVHDGDGTRRDFLFLATGAAGVVAVGGIAFPLVSQLAPNAREEAAGAPTEIDISAIEPGMQLVVIWRGKPYFIRRLTDKEVTAVEEAPQTKFRDFVAADTRISAVEGGKKEWAVVGANCTHLGCVPTKVETGFEGWVCACHGSKFDVLGRVIKGPAPTNLPLPPFEFASNELLIIGQEKAGAHS